MNANKTSSAPDWIDPDDGPDTSTPESVAYIDKTGVFARCRPKSHHPKVAQTLRFDHDVIAFF